MYNLRRSGCSQQVMFDSYVAFIRSVLLFAYPVFSNAPDYLLSRLASFENRVYCIIGYCDGRPLIHDVATKICNKLFMNIVKRRDHPLRVMFQEVAVRPTRHSSRLRPHFAKTERFRRSFIRFCK